VLELAPRESGNASIEAIVFPAAQTNVDPMHTVRRSDRQLATLILENPSEVRKVKKMTPREQLPMAMYNRRTSDDGSVIASLSNSVEPSQECQWLCNRLAQQLSMALSSMLTPPLSPAMILMGTAPAEKLHLVGVRDAPLVGPLQEKEDHARAGTVLDCQQLHLRTHKCERSPGQDLWRRRNTRVLLPTHL
jgi:hypothetical protein